jgi:hypothetical protein
MGYAHPTHGAPGYSGPIYIRKVAINRQGYDSQGRYWGTGKPLFEVSSEGEGPELHLRADSRDEVKREMKRRYPHARIR